MSSPLSLYGLLHLAEKESSAQNVKVRNFGDQRSLYLRNAAALSRSLQTQGVEFKLLTNDKPQVERSLAELNLVRHVQCEEVSFETHVPSGVAFYSAHFKFDVFRYFAAQPEHAYLGLVDLDMIAINPLPQCLAKLAEMGIPVYYDISDQVIPAYGHERIRADMSRLSPHICEGRWSGGELIFGRPDFFASLTREADAIFSTYRDLYTELHHQGDEIITSTALEALRFRDGVVMAEGGKLGIVGRYWSRPVKHPQPSFDYFSNAFLLHLPADKQWLADTALPIAGNGDKLQSEYRRHLGRIFLKNSLRNLKSFIEKRAVRA